MNYKQRALENLDEFKKNSSDVEELQSSLKDRRELRRIT